MTSSAPPRTGVSEPGEGDGALWLRGWLSACGFEGVHVEDMNLRVLALSLAAEFETWCEEERISRKELEQARQAVSRFLDPQALPDWDSYLVATDAGAWHELRRQRHSSDAA